MQKKKIKEKKKALTKNEFEKHITTHKSYYMRISHVWH